MVKQNVQTQSGPRRVPAQTESLPSRLRYALITPARNEAHYIESTIRSVIAQTRRPVRWVIVNDGSADATAGIIDKYASEHEWIRRLDMPAHRDRSFAAKAHCFRAGVEALDGAEYEIVGNLDADIEFDSEYRDFLVSRFERTPTLGVAGTPFVEDGYDSARHSFEGAAHVPGGCQLFRRECLVDIGGYVPNRAGGVDWIAVTTARMKGWSTRSFDEKRLYTIDVRYCRARRLRRSICLRRKGLLPR